MNVALVPSAIVATGFLPSCAMIESAPDSTLTRLLQYGHQSGAIG